MMRDTMAVAIPKRQVALAGVPVKGHTTANDLKLKTYKTIYKYSLNKF